MSRWRDRVLFADYRTGPAIKFSKNKATIRSQPPLHGENTNEVLASFGVDAAELETLEKEGVIKNRTWSDT